MTDSRRTNPRPLPYTHFLALSELEGGKLDLNSEDTLAYWITVLHRENAEAEFGTNSDPIAEAPRPMVLGKGKDREAFTEVDLLMNDPRHLLDETWTGYAANCC
jgi:hypothetical protein